MVWTLQNIGAFVFMSNCYILFTNREVTPKKNIGGGPKVKNVDLFGQGGKCGPFCGQLSADGANATAKGT